MIGFVMLMGLVTKNAILLVDFANRARRSGVPLREALMSAGQVRLRPILMTTAAMIFGMLPLALGLGASGETQAPMGRAIIGGVITSTVLTLVVVPVIYTYLDRFTEWRKARRAVRDSRVGAPADAPAPGD
jgi:multidrug efflux pump subunit AcrB